MKTATVIEKVKSTHQELLAGANISQNDWFWLLIELGSIYAERIANLYTNNKEVEALLKYNKQFGYWQWFKSSWLLDDAVLVDAAAYSTTSYKILKGYMLQSETLEKELMYKINKQMYA